MRRLIAINLTAVLLAPWIAALSGAAIPIVPCPMHRAAGPTSEHHAAATAGMHHDAGEHQNSSHHGTSARGCNCVGECGRSGAAFTLPVTQLIGIGRRALADATIRNGQSDFSPATGLLPPSTGPPQRLQA